MSPPAQAKSTSQRLQALERRITVRARALAALQRDDQRLVLAHNDLVARMDALNTRYTALSTCIQRTPVYSWPGFEYNGGVTTTLTRWYNPNNAFSTNVFEDPSGKIHELGLNNTDACIGTIAFYNPVSGAGATAGLGAKSTQERTP